MRSVDITDHRFGKLVAVKRSGRDHLGKTLWECMCDCGNVVNIAQGNLHSGNSKSCGCEKYSYKDMRGQSFGRLLVQELVGRKNNVVVWRCVCKCGNVVEVKGTNLRSGHTTSCGCSRIKHGRSYSTSKNELDKTYISWRSMIQRCSDPNAYGFAHYGKRGIKVCARWKGDLGFIHFLEDMGERPDNTTLGRINNNGDYEAYNCRWETPFEQSINKSNSHVLTIDGESKTVAEWSLVYGVKHSTITERLKRGWSPNNAVKLQPIKARR